MNQQDPTLSSSSRREISPAPETVHAKSIGCMSSIFQFASKYHSHRPRFLTSGKKQEKNDHETSKNGDHDIPKSKKDVVPRSPTLPAEMRVTPPALVARLMGLSEIPAAELAVAEKRRRLIGALEKCDEDLKSLKRMIEVVQSVSENRIRLYYGKSRREKWDELMSSVSVVDEFTRSAFCGFSSKYNLNGRAAQQGKMKTGEEDTESDEKFVSWALCRNTAIVESVSEVCRDMEWGQRREIGRIGLALQDYIFKDIIEECVREMGCCCFYPPPPLPLESCKRRLHF